MINKNTIIILILIIFVVIIIFYYESKIKKDSIKIQEKHELISNEHYQNKQPDLKCPPCPQCPSLKELINERIQKERKKTATPHKIIVKSTKNQDDDVMIDYKQNPLIHQNINIDVNEIDASGTPMIANGEMPLPIGNMVRDYDYNNVYDELKRPTYRPSMNVLGPGFIPPIYVNGPRDAPTWVGIIVFDDTKTNQKVTDKNKILRVYGRERYYHSNDYEYYAVIDSGSGKTKISIVREDGRRNELYDGDKVKVPVFDNAIYKFTRNEHQIFDND